MSKITMCVSSHLIEEDARWWERHPIFICLINHYLVTRGLLNTCLRFKKVPHIDSLELHVKQAKLVRNMSLLWEESIGRAEGRHLKTKSSRLVRPRAKSRRQGVADWLGRESTIDDKESRLHSTSDPSRIHDRLVVPTGWSTTRPTRQSV